MSDEFDSVNSPSDGQPKLDADSGSGGVSQPATPDRSPDESGSAAASDTPASFDPKVLEPRGPSTPLSKRPTAEGLSETPETMSVVRSNILASLNIRRPAPLAIEPRDANPAGELAGATPVDDQAGSDRAGSSVGSTPPSSAMGGGWPEASSQPTSTSGWSSPAGEDQGAGGPAPFSVYSAPAEAQYPSDSQGGAMDESATEGNLSDTTMFSSVGPADLTENALSSRSNELEAEAGEPPATAEIYSLTSYRQEADPEPEPEPEPSWQPASLSERSAPAAATDLNEPATGSWAPSFAKPAEQAPIEPSSSLDPPAGAGDPSSATADFQAASPQGGAAEAQVHDEPTSAGQQPELDEQEEVQMSTPEMPERAPVYGQTPQPTATATDPLTPSPSHTSSWTETTASAGAPETAPAAGLQAKVQEIIAERPEVVLAAAFAGGILLATILRSLARR